MAAQVTDQKRDEFEAALLAALLMVYRGSMRQALAALGSPTSPQVTAEAQQRFEAFAKDRAEKVQAGINERLAATEDPSSGTTPEDVMKGAQEHHRTTLIPFVTSYAWHQGLVDAYAQTPSDQVGADGEPLSERDARLWQWTRYTDNPPEDECEDAMNASPATYADLMAVADGPPPRHENCACRISPL